MAHYYSLFTLSYPYYDRTCFASAIRLRTFSSSPVQLPPSISSFEKSCEPSPTHIAPGVKPLFQVFLGRLYTAGYHQIKIGHYRHDSRYETWPQYRTRKHFNNLGAVLFSRNDLGKRGGNRVSTAGRAHDILRPSVELENGCDIIKCAPASINFFVVAPSIIVPMPSMRVRVFACHAAADG